jgi:DNA-binding PadR family transcriptional regulator
MLEYIILGFLMCGETSGYAIKKWMTKSTSYFFDASYGSIYPALKRLEQKGMVTFRELMEGNKYKKIYQISESGRECFMKWINESIVFEKSRQDHLVKIFFYEFLPKEKAIANLKAFIEEVELVAKNLTNEKEKAEKEFDIYKYYYRYSTMIYGIEYYQFIISWCKDLILELETNPQTDGSIRLENLNM